MRSKNTSVRRLITLCGLLAAISLILGSPLSASAQDKGGESPQKQGKDSDKVDISDLENKYWAPKDTDFSVVQNRTYTKAGRFFLSGQYGPVINDQFNDGNALGVSANYFFDERYGLQLDYMQTDMTYNDSTNFLLNWDKGGVIPDHNRIQGGYYLGFNWVPFYAKMSVLGSRIIYFDMAFTPIVGMTNYEQQLRDGNKAKSAFTYGFNLTQFFFLNNHIAIRADVRSIWYTEEVLEWRKQYKIHDKSTQKTIFIMGLTYYF